MHDDHKMFVYMIVYIYFNCSALHNSRINEEKGKSMQTIKKIHNVCSFKVQWFYPSIFYIIIIIISILLCIFIHTLTFLDLKLIFFSIARHFTSCIITVHIWYWINFISKKFVSFLHVRTVGKRLYNIKMSFNTFTNTKLIFIFLFS
jgi:hypothetical protein